MDLNPRYLQPTSSSNLFAQKAKINRKFHLSLKYSELRRSRNDLVKQLSSLLEELKKADETNIAISTKHVTLMNRLKELKKDYDHKNDEITKQDLQKLDLSIIRKQCAKFEKQIANMNSLTLMVHNIKHISTYHHKRLATETQLEARRNTILLHKQRTSTPHLNISEK